MKRELHPLLLTELFEDWAIDRVGGKRGFIIFMIGLFPSVFISAALLTIPSWIVILKGARS